MPAPVAARHAAAAAAAAATAAATASSSSATASAAEGAVPAGSCAALWLAPASFPAMASAANPLGVFVAAAGVLLVKLLPLADAVLESIPGAGVTGSFTAARDALEKVSSPAAEDGPAAASAAACVLWPLLLLVPVAAAVLLSLLLVLARSAAKLLLSLLLLLEPLLPFATLLLSWLGNR